MKRILLQQYVEMVATYMAMLALIGLHGKPILDSFQMWDDWSRGRQGEFVVKTIIYSIVWVVVYIRFKRCEKRLVERRPIPPTLIALPKSCRFKYRDYAGKKLMARRETKAPATPAFVMGRDNVG